jgi:hypothetical protein
MRGGTQARQNLADFWRKLNRIPVCQIHQQLKRDKQEKGPYPRLLADSAFVLYFSHSPFFYRDVIRFAQKHSEQYGGRIPVTIVRIDDTKQEVS